MFNTANIGASEMETEDMKKEDIQKEDYDFSDLEAPPIDWTKEPILNKDGKYKHQYITDYHEYPEKFPEIKRFEGSQYLEESEEICSKFDSGKDLVTEEDLKDDPVLFKPNFLTKGELHILAGKAGVGKSFLGLQLAYSLAAGKPFLEMECIESQKVAYLSFEDNKARLLKRLQAIGWTGESKPRLLLYTDLEPLIISSSGRPQVTELGKFILNRIKEKKADTVIIDTYSQAFLHEDGDNRASQAVGNWIKKELKSKTVIIIHHLRKAEEFKKAEEITIDAIRGASALVGYSRSAFFLSGVDDKYLLKMLKSNYGQPFSDYRDGPYIQKDIVEKDGRKIFKGFKKRSSSADHFGD